ncbi:MAG: class II aldolase/adducin family protein [Syntrophaceae bacterium]
MMDQVQKYHAKLIRQGLVDTQGAVELYGLDDEIYSNRDGVPEAVSALFGRLNINSLIIARPNPVQWAIIQELSRINQTLICPCDCESLTFIHDIPLVAHLEPSAVAQALNRRKGCIVKDVGIVTTGSVSLEQAFISLSSICFATFVKFFVDCLNGLTGFGARPEARSLDMLSSVMDTCRPLEGVNTLSRVVPKSEDAILESLDQTGKIVVDRRLVDSFFGNISYRDAGIIYISQTGSSLDELPGHIDRVPLDGSSTCELTASSELLAHVRVYEHTGDKAILHGHPRFSVIMSMHGKPLSFDEKRFVADVPVVAGEVGAGRHGLVHTLPAAMEQTHAAIVHGHGTFASSPGTVSEAFDALSAIEHLCYERYQSLMTKYA